MKTFTKISMISALVVLITSCASVGQSSPKQDELTGNRWVLTNYDGKQLSNSGIILTFDKEKKMVYGTAPCNNFFSGYALEGDSGVKFGAAGTTQKFCQNTQIEDGFKRELQFMVQYKIEGSELRLMNAGGRILAVLTSTSPETQPR